MRTLPGSMGEKTCFSRFRELWILSMGGEFRDVVSHS
jgi:hypothetical protein